MAKKRKPSKRKLPKSKAPKSKRRKSRTTSKPKSTKKTLFSVAGVASFETAAKEVTMTIDFGAGAPGDIQSVKRIDGKALAGSTASVGSGGHTTGWDVVSPTVTPIKFAVTVTDSAGKKLVDRPSEKTGVDGKGSGADSFEV